MSLRSTSSANPISPHPLSPSSHPSPALQAQATQLLLQAQLLIAQTTEEIRALEHCLAVLKAAPADACFFFSADPPTLTPAVGRKPGSQVATTLLERVLSAQQYAPARLEQIRLQTLFTLSRLGFPIALWHFLVPSPLPLTVAALAPPGTRPASPPREALPPPGS